MKQKLQYITLILMAFALPLCGCGDFLLKAKDGSLINGRSMEFAQELESTIKIHSRGEKRQSTALNNQPGVRWISRYGFVSATALGLDYATDGLNEAGLSVGLLWLPGITEYQKVTLQDAGRTLAVEDLGNFILGNFATVDEVKEGLRKLLVWGHNIEQLGNTIPPVHLAIHDAQGNSAVIEFINGEQRIHDNPVATLTNSPDFNWHLTNLSNYINLSALNAKSLNLSGTVLQPPGQGSGLQGIPGDWLPSSRFVRIVMFKSFALQPSNAKEGIILAQHILNTVDIPKGDVREKASGPNAFDYTQWIAIKDITNKVYYFRSYDNLTLRAVDLKQLNLNPGNSFREIPISIPFRYIDLTADVRGL